MSQRNARIFLTTIEHNRKSLFQRMMVNPLEITNEKIFSKLGGKKFIRMWGFDSSAKNKTIWNNISKNDWVLFNMEGKYAFAATVQAKQDDERLGRHIMAVKLLEKITLLVSFQNVIPISKGIHQTNHDFGINPKVPEMHKISLVEVNPNVIIKILKKYHTIEKYLGIEKIKEEKTNELPELVAASIQEPPSKCRTNVLRIIRDTKRSTDLKKVYGNKCQLCSFTFPSEIFGYSEAHHVWPLGEGGLDDFDNMLVLCPNHHVEFDYAVVRFDLKNSEKIVDYLGNLIGILHYQKGHSLSRSNIEYHNTRRAR